VLRFWNNQVFENIEGVLEAIWMAITPTLSQAPSLTPTLPPQSALTPTLSQREREHDPHLPSEREHDPHLPSPSGRGVGGEGESAIFWRFAEAGAKLAQLHLNYETAAEYRLTWIENREVPFSWRVAKMKLSSDKTQLIINESLTLASIPPACFRYRLGNRSALEWVIDQYQISTDKRSQITSDPNRADDEEYIVRLVGRVITVSIETMQIVDSLPAWESIAIATEQENKRTRA
jgi:hypothetical protein